jgi:hypothetical protein
MRIYRIPKSCRIEPWLKVWSAMTPPIHGSCEMLKEASPVQYCYGHQVCDYLHLTAEETRHHENIQNPEKLSY